MVGAEGIGPWVVACNYNNFSGSELGQYSRREERAQCRSALRATINEEDCPNSPARREIKK